MVINRPLLGVIQTGKKAHVKIVCELTNGLGADAIHQGLTNWYPDNTCWNTCFNKVDSTKAADSMNNKPLNHLKDSAWPRLKNGRMSGIHSSNHKI